MTPLERSGRPLFFESANPGLTAPDARRGVAVRVWARSLEGMQKEALVLSTRTGRLWRLASDEGAYLMGADIAPCPLSFMTAGMVSSYVNEIQALGAERGVPVDRLRIVQDNYYTMTGSALKGSMTGGALPVELRVEAGGQVAGLVEEAVSRAPVTGLMRNVLESVFTLTHNQRAIETGRVHAMIAAALPFARGIFDAAQPVNHSSDLIRRNGPSPLTSEVTSSTGSSLAEEQSRRLHVRGICTLGEDGVKQVEQHLYNPHGTIFHTRCDERGRAPDAASYMSVGIAFCFMTQFGRFAKIAKKDLQEYCVVQDTHFGSGSADPVETHVHLFTREDDAFARHLLDMSEQTCFLHALCRASLTPKVDIVRRAAG